ncbi:hypothetical protein RRG08_009524 [Elysia crispata]|uniref:Uncharacterized protein n=1 Tax=Elysia crispata TaxID=231223 RepID=A0AAE1B260_9GAST|nr:hypothetical protein RRG08_009524 [Elysia crispata]
MSGGARKQIVFTAPKGVQDDRGIEGGIPGNVKLGENMSWARSSAALQDPSAGAQRLTWSVRRLRFSLGALATPLSCAIGLSRRAAIGSR